MDVEAVLKEKIAEIKASYLARSGHPLGEADLWFGENHWTVFLRVNKPRYESHCGNAKTFADIDRAAAEVIEELAARVTHTPTATEIAQKIGLSEDQLCEIVCASKHAEAA